MKCVILWDVESIPFYYCCLVHKYIKNAGYIPSLNPKFVALSKKNISAMHRVPKKRGYEWIVTEDISKDGADRVLFNIVKVFSDRVPILISNDLRLAKKILKKNSNLILFYINKDIPADTLGIQTYHVFDNFSWN